MSVGEQAESEDVAIPPPTPTAAPADASTSEVAAAAAGDGAQPPRDVCDEAAAQPAPAPDESVAADVGARNDATADKGADPVRMINVFMSPINTWLAANMVETFREKLSQKATAGSPESVTPSATPSSGDKTAAVSSTEDEAVSSLKDEPKINFVFTGTAATEGETFDPVTEGVQLPPGIQIISREPKALAAAIAAADWVVCSIADNHDSNAEIDTARDIFAMVRSGKRDAAAGPIKFVLVSTFLTWAKTPPLIPGETEMALTTDQFIFRQPHPSVRAHFELENEVAKCTDTPQLHSTVVTAGMLYGNGEGPLEFMFRAAWMPLGHGVPILNGGANHIPTIHILDACKLVQNVLMLPTAPAECYVAVDSTPREVTMRSVAEAIAKGFQVDPTRPPPEPENFTMLDAYLENDLSQLTIDVLTADVHLEASIYDPCFQFDMVSPGGIVPHISARINEYVTERSLHPYRVCVLGPPSSGKSTIARDLALRFGLLLVDSASAVKYAKIDSEHAVQKADAHLEKLQQDEAAEADVVTEAQKRRSKLAAELDVFTSPDTLDNETVARCVKQMLKSKVCTHQGYVLDGYPTTAPQVDAMGWSANAAAATPGEDTMTNAPDHLVILEATETCVLRRLLQLSQEAVFENEHNSIDTFRQRWAEYVASTTHSEKKPAKGATMKGAADGGVFDPQSLFGAVDAEALKYNLDELTKNAAKGATDDSTVALCNSLAQDLGYATHSSHGKVLTFLKKFRSVFSTLPFDVAGSAKVVNGLDRWARKFVAKRHQHYGHHKSLSVHDHTKHRKRRTARDKYHKKHTATTHHGKHHTAHHATHGRGRGHKDGTHGHGTHGHGHHTIDSQHHDKQAKGYHGDAPAPIKVEQPAAPPPEESKPHDESGEGVKIVPPRAPIELNHEQTWKTVEQLVEVTFPAQRWLQTTVLPGLGDVLLQVAREQPDDPISFISAKLKTVAPVKMPAARMVEIPPAQSPEGFGKEAAANVTADAPDEHPVVDDETTQAPEVDAVAAE
mmetsp:Transcript_16751/g.43479  ORF Transcript_16751/g.43479 Transcript_16751/m.43479 type:complete len:1016 (+) Transcript_16751:214-3261(+)